MLGRRSKIGSSSIRQAGQHATPFREVYTRNPTQQARESGAAWKPSLSATKHCSTSRPHKTHDQRHSQPPNSQHAPARPRPPKEETAYTVGPARHSGRNPRRRRGRLPEARDHGGSDGKARENPHSQVGPPTRAQHLASCARLPAPPQYSHPSSTFTT